MRKRDFLKLTGITTTGLAIAPSILLSCRDKEGNNQTPISAKSAVAASFELPKLAYGYDAFTDVIDAQTMEIHHSKHHQGYTNNLNNALAENNISGKTIEEILKMNDLPTSIRNNGGGYYNHCLYWDILKPGGAMPEGLGTQITSAFGSAEAMENQLKDAGAKQFGSGWAWLCQDTDKQLFITSTANQDNPLMTFESKQGHPILGIDVWEHAYYLKYQNKRGDYLNNIFSIINWEVVASKMI
ncbi:superoxide dismutase [Paucihalobacter ruber]|uniref:Superoxide dismutase n=1 Tax=Paucihalobacter ruber TaxID=2567861 RepID=A0A506PH34_9FLAO|nr:superoxide dismutase [Paucihalobacter ruber]TPV32929.1 superoxide dismutase [Paucihalobacter ruber]